MSPALKSAPDRAPAAPVVAPDPSPAPALAEPTAPATPAPARRGWTGDQIAMAVWLIAAAIMGTMLFKDLVVALILR